jgi:hypothetical protein
MQSRRATGLQPRGNPLPHAVSQPKHRSTEPDDKQYAAGERHADSDLRCEEDRFH